MLKQGDGVFYTDNIKRLPSEYCDIAVSIIHDLGLTYFFYEGIDLASRGSSLDAEIRNDFYNAKVVILVLGKGEAWRDLQDNWATPELEYASKLGIKLIIYTITELTATEIKELGLPNNPIFIKDKEHYKTELQTELKRSMSP